jgi:hypothetical protein
MIASANWLPWLENSTLAQLVRQFYPYVEIVHITSFSILVGAIVILDLRLLGYSARLSVLGIERLLSPFMRAGFTSASISGFLLFSAQPSLLAANPAFRLKLLLIALACLNAAAFHRGPFRAIKQWNRNIKTPFIVKAIAILSLLIWGSAIVCGRLIAYV